MLFEPQLLCLPSDALLTHLGQKQKLDLRHLHGKPGMNYWFLARPNPGHCDNLGSETRDQSSLPTPTQSRYFCHSVSNSFLISLDHFNSLCIAGIVYLIGMKSLFPRFVSHAFLDLKVRITRTQVSYQGKGAQHHPAFMQRNIRYRKQFCFSHCKKNGKAGQVQRRHFFFICLSFFAFFVWSRDK